MTLDQVLCLLLAIAVLYRLHRRAMEKAEERFEKCDKERVLLHNLYYQKFGADFGTGGAQDQPLAESEAETPESRYREKIDEMKRQLKRLARTRPSQLGRELRRMEKRGRPRLDNIMPRMDSTTAQQAKQRAQDLLGAIEHTVKNGRPTHTGG